MRNSDYYSDYLVTPETVPLDGSGSPLRVAMGLWLVAHAGWEIERSLKECMTNRAGQILTHPPDRHLSKSLNPLVLELKSSTNRIGNYGHPLLYHYPQATLRLCYCNAASQTVVGGHTYTVPISDM